MIKQMIGLSLGLWVLTAAAAPEPALAPEMQEYKCHITMAKADKVVFYRWKVKDVNLSIASLPGKRITDADGKKSFINDVVECVPLSQDFTSEQSKQLDKITLR
ncbi:MAG: TapY2 family type IVa secretion system protein [Shewanella sp.]